MNNLIHCPTCLNKTPRQTDFEWDRVEVRLTLHCDVCDTEFTVVYIVACVEDVTLGERANDY